MRCRRRNHGVKRLRNTTARRVVEDDTIDLDGADSSCKPAKPAPKGTSTADSSSALPAEPEQAARTEAGPGQKKSPVIPPLTLPAFVSTEEAKPAFFTYRNAG